MEKMTKEYARGYTDAISHIQNALADLSGQMEAVKDAVLDSAFEKDKKQTQNTKNEEPKGE